MPIAAIAVVAIGALGASGDEAPSPDRIHQDAIVVDGHNDVATLILDYGFDLGMDGSDPEKRAAELYWVLGGLLPPVPGEALRTHTDLARLRRGGVDAVFFSIFVHPKYKGSEGGLSGRAHAMIDALEAQLELHASDLELATSAGDVRRIAREGKIAALMGLEGGDAIEHKFDKLRALHARGVRYMTLTWSNTHNWADSSSDERRHGGLTPFGRDVVREMNRIGMVVDVSHCSDETFWDVVDVARAPIIASHSSARSLVDNPRNMSDDMLRAVGENGGVVMVNFGGSFVDPRKASYWKIASDVITHFGPSPVPLEMVVDHIDHVARVAGMDHVGLGSDFDGTLFMPEGLSDVSGFPNVTAALLARGFSEADVRKILGGNALRVLEQVEAAAE